MAEEGPEASVASSVTAAGHWWEIHASPLSSWNTMRRWPLPQADGNASSSSYDDADMLSISNTTSFTNASTHSALSMDSSSAELVGAPVENHIWSQLLLNVGTNGEARSSRHEDGENSLEVLSSSWALSPSSLNCLEKHLSSCDGLPNNLSDLVTNWSIAPPKPQLHQYIAPSTCAVSIDRRPLVAHYSASDASRAKHEGGNSTSYSPSYDHSMKGAATPFFPGPIGLDESDVPRSNRRNLSDQIFFAGCLNMKPSVNGSDSCHGNRCQGSTITGNGKVSRATEGKKKRSEDSSETHLKKPKPDGSMVSSQKEPKVKIAEKVSALQQLVSPFGKTDQASVLMETITCITVLQKQVQEQNSWGELERKEKAEAKYDLRSRGLCLVPVASIPQFRRESNRPDYWMPTYRSCLYR
ncbi:HLH [Musa troglodytarum]|uniref:HLH n=1 Tax=Musa troglodytarum TaxID=320322 RepID=A0A9E7FYF5_9LILI|nr:HLH [Musa troglodytarum]